MTGMFFPFDSLIAEHRQLGLVVALLIGFAFGFVLERAGFGRSTKLAAQFYLTDLTVFKVMFGAIITAMLGLVVAAGVGLVDLAALSAQAVSFTYLWPMLFGGLLLGVGFIVSGYCPGTSIVASASGNLDGVATVGGVVVGSVLYGELYALFPAVSNFHSSSNMGHFFLYQWLGIPVPVLAVVVTAVALGGFVGAEKVERLMAARKAKHEAEAGDGFAIGTAPRRPRPYVFSALAGTAVLALATLALPVAPKAAAPKRAGTIAQNQLARRVLDAAWTMRILDVRAKKSCAKQRIPGAECVPLKSLGQLGLAYAPASRDLVLVGSGTLDPAYIKAALAYGGEVRVLSGGFDGWRRYALSKPVPPKPGAPVEAQQAFSFRAALYTAMTGAAPPPPPAAGPVKFVPKKKKGGGGCG